MPTLSARPRLLALGLILVAVLLGLVGGVALDRWVLRPTPAQAEPSALWRRMGFGPVAGAGLLRERFVRQLAGDIGLSKDQLARVDSLLRTQQERTRAVMARVTPDLAALSTATEAGLRAILTPEQWGRFEEVRSQRAERRRAVLQRMRVFRDTAVH